MGRNGREIDADHKQNREGGAHEDRVIPIHLSRRAAETRIASKRNEASWDQLLLGVVFAPGGIILAVVLPVVILMGGLGRVSMANESLEWPGVPGVITISSIDGNTSVGVGDSSTKTTYSPKISFEYEVEGRRYESNRVTFGNVGSSYERAKQVVDRYSIGNEVVVFYDPAEPTRAVLEPGKGPSMSGAVGAACAFSLVGLGFSGIGVILLKDYVRRRRAN